jgi:serine/threonine protein kinase
MWSLGVIVFILLSGYPPFTDSDKRALFRKIQKGKFDFHPDYWGGISEEAKEMVKGLLTVDPKKRLSAKELLETEWIHFDANESLASYDVMEPNFAKLKRFNTKRKVRAAVSTVVAINRLTTLATVVGREVVIPTTPQQ